MKFDRLLTCIPLHRSAAFPNAKLVPPQRGDNDFMMRSRKLNCASDMLEDSLRAKVTNVLFS